MSLKIRFAHRWVLPALALLLCAYQSQSVEQTQPSETAQQQEQPVKPAETPAPPEPKSPMCA